MKKRLLILEDGSVYEGCGFGADHYQVGELVFNTGMSGYQEVLSDLSYCGQIVMMTYPMIGNYGINRDDFESLDPAVFGFVVKEYCAQPSNFRCDLTLQKQQIILYPKVQLLRIIQELQQQDKTNYFQQTIAPLKEYPFLLDTLIKYFRNNENQKQTCKELFIHVNTLQYRLKKIEALCGLHMNDMQEKINLYVSLLSHMMENWRNDNDND